MRTVSLYRYLWTCQADRRRGGQDQRWDCGVRCTSGVLGLVASLCVTALACSQALLVRCSALPGALQGRRGGRRLGALCTMLLLLTLLVVSGPHLVHHLADPAAQDDHHTHTGPAHPPPDCLVFFVLQHTPLAAGVLANSLTPLAAAEPIVCTPPVWLSAAPRYVPQARAPPAGFLSSLVSD